MKHKNLLSNIDCPVMVLPYKLLTKLQDTSGKISYKESLTNVYILPETLNMDSKVKPEVLHRGIFDAIVYSTKIRVSGKFSPLELKKSGINPEMIQWDKAKIDFGISDLKGLKNNPVIRLAGKSYNIEPDFTDLRLFTNNLVILPDLDSVKNTSLDFSFDLDLRGSDELSFLHLGKSTTVKLAGNWNNPSFMGRYLPDNREVTDDGFMATWKMPYFNRPYAQQWMAENSIIDVKTSDASFGVKFILPVDQYQKTMRSAKYAILIILLTFISLFFTEIIQKRKVHFLQYLLIGAAMTVYYTLLLSFSEQMGFTAAYLIASVATIVLIGFFIAGVLKSRKPAMVFAAILSVFYSFIYVIIQLQDLALLFGSVGLFLIIAVMMFLSAKINWSKDSAAELAV
ncbi:MAG: cell envelope integrity protein CreD [Sphingobacteriaceae bacterium]|nr:MAG: cell envelope integrity protein CreD [Sphingobacteriaceae bacterium]